MFTDSEEMAIQIKNFFTEAGMSSFGLKILKSQAFFLYFAYVWKVNKLHMGSINLPSVDSITEALSIIYIINTALNCYYCSH